LGCELPVRLHRCQYLEARGSRDVLMEHERYVEMIRLGMDQNADVMDLPPDADDRADRIARAVSHIDWMLADSDLIANSTDAERANWKAAADRGRL